MFSLLENKINSIRVLKIALAGFTISGQHEQLSESEFVIRDEVVPNLSADDLRTNRLMTFRSDLVQ